jgi:hypothetical protein
VVAAVSPDVDMHAFGRVVVVHQDPRSEMDSFLGVSPRTGLRVPLAKRLPGDPLEGVTR